MRKLILTTASVLALSLAAGGAYAQAPSGSAGQPAQPQTGMNAQNTAPTNPAAQAQSPQQENMQAQAPQENTQSPNGTMGNQPSQAMNETGHMSKSQVKQLQRKLRAEGLYHGRIDGIIGPETRQAMSQMQERQSGMQNNAVGEGSSAPPANEQPGEASGAQNMQPGATSPTTNEGAYGHAGSGANNNNGSMTPYQK